MKPAQTLVVGIGNLERGDDAAGLEVARRLKERRDGTIVLESSGDAAELMEAWRQAAQVIVVDALEANGSPGRVYRLEPGPKPLPSALRHASTHSFGLATAVELARALGRLPPRLVVYGIEGASFGNGRGLSPEVARAVEEAVARVAREVEEARAA
jgi:hydrogenase maturation protease